MTDVTNQASVTLLIVDDHPIVRDGLRSICETDPRLEVMGLASDGQEAYEMANALRPDVILMDLNMPKTGGLAAIKKLAERGCSSRILVLTTYETDHDVLPAIKAGATGYLLKDSPTQELIEAILATNRGEAVLSASVAARLSNQTRNGDGEVLSDREREVLTLVSRGQSNREAAASLFLSEATIKTHLLHIYTKLGVKDRAAAVRKGFELRMLTQEE